jgi:hypothetical protein
MYKSYNEGHELREIKADKNLPEADDLIKKRVEDVKPVQDFGDKHHGEENGKTLIKDYISTDTIENL